MKITKLLLLGLSTLVFWGCSTKPSTYTEIKYFHSDRSLGKTEDDKSDWIKSITQYKEREDGESYGSYGESPVKHGWCKSYYTDFDVDEPNHLRDSILYDRGEEKEIYQFYPNGQLKNIFINEIIECKTSNPMDMMSSDPELDFPSLNTERISHEGYYENGQMERKWINKVVVPGDNPKCREISRLDVSQVGWYENGQMMYKHTYRKDGTDLTKDRWNEDGTWDGGSFFNKDGQYPKSKKSFEDTNNPYSY